MNSYPCLSPYNSQFLCGLRGLSFLYLPVLWVCSARLIIKHIWINDESSYQIPWLALSVPSQKHSTPFGIFSLGISHLLSEN